jgi:Ser/Thr protein kinase RdoA (MazF antagonist)
LGDTLLHSYKPQQVIHGDFTETNLFFDKGSVNAIIDWENSYLAPRAWEVARTLDLLCRYDLARCQAFLAGYRSRLPLALVDLASASAAYAELRAHDLWIATSILGGDERPRRFLNPAGFHPLWPRWLVLAALLDAPEIEESGVRSQHSEGRDRVAGGWVKQ